MCMFMSVYAYAINHHCDNVLFVLELHLQPPTSHLFVPFSLFLKQSNKPETTPMTTSNIVEDSFSARVPRSSAEVRRVFNHDIKEVEGVGQQEQQGDQRDDKEGDEVKGEVEEIRGNAHRAHET